MSADVKVVISLPADLYRAVERARKQRRRTRSAVVQEALRHWLRSESDADLVRAYEAGYRRRPEDRRDVDDAMATAIPLLRDDD